MKRISTCNIYYESEQNLYYSSSRINLTSIGYESANGDYHEEVEEEEYMSRHNANFSSLLNVY